jgi:formylglycine-generating enzyme required for sulfatase activity
MVAKMKAIEQETSVGGIGEETASDRLPEELPDNVPDLMLQYVAELNRNVREGKIEDTEVFRLAKVIAWKCVEPTFKPESAKSESVREALAELYPDEEEPKKFARQQLLYLVKQLSLLRFKQPGQETLRFALDPLAEYLAGLYLVEQFGGDEAKWRQEILEPANGKPGAPQEIAGFLLALRDCCEEKGKLWDVPPWLADELATKAGLDLAAVRQAQQQRYIRQMLDNLSAADRYIRLRALEDLGKMAAEDAATVQAALAIPRLRRVLEDGTEEPKLRQAASWVLSQLGANIPMLLAEINAGKVSLQLVQPPVTVLEELAEGIPLEMVEIPGGEFWMGAAEGEEGAGESEYPRHPVKISPFLMGKYPVTQAQWRAVAALPTINRDLEPNPAYFPGDSKPVESISWYDAVEFCERLSRFSQEKGKGYQYRLPSEAEWEYACRSVISYQLSVTSRGNPPVVAPIQNPQYPPFHFGETISTDLANYDGNHAYGTGERGENRAQTTPVGLFQVANAFGLYDLHGNVWEWCADDWHENYEGAPIDGNAWLDGGDDSRSPLRGGSWYFYPRGCRSAFRGSDRRDYVVHDIGFRVVCVSGRTL